jgi:hypothetical protein
MAVKGPRRLKIMVTERALLPQNYGKRLGSPAWHML